jgi:hypothetical protein
LDDSTKKRTVKVRQLMTHESSSDFVNRFFVDKMLSDMKQKAFRLFWGVVSIIVILSMVLMTISFGF